MDKLHELQVSTRSNISFKFVATVRLYARSQLFLILCENFFFRKNHLKELETKELLEQGLYIASLIALTPAIIIFFSYK